MKAPQPMPIEALVNTTSILELDKLEVYYGAFRAVRGVTLGIRANEITAFIGPSGCRCGVMCSSAMIVCSLPAQVSSGHHLGADVE